jgi:hypothetical protein
MWLMVWLSNSAHFAGSTVRLYTKPGAFQTNPFVTMGLPLVTLAVLGFGLLWPEPIGQSLQALYLTWSPYHYAAQSYGLAVMYGYRSGSVDDGMKKLMRLAAMLPFAFLFVTSDCAGLGWLLPGEILAPPGVAAARGLLGSAPIAGGGRRP